MAPLKRPSIAPPNDDSRYVSEKTIFRLADPKIDDAEWPVFELRDVAVMDKSRRYLRNLLRIEETGPYIVRGRVYCDMMDRLQVAQLLQPKAFKPAFVEIVASSMSIGLDDFDTGENGEEVSGPVIWAKSFYGFFRICTPAPCYKVLFNHSLEAITLYYSIMSVYEEHSIACGNQRHDSTGKLRVVDLPLNDTFLKYAVMIGDGCVLEEVINRCIIHSPFLSSQFKFESTFAWEKTRFHKFVKNQVAHGRAWEQAYLENILIDDESVGDPKSLTQLIKPVVIPESQSSLEDAFSENPEPLPAEVTKFIAAGKQIVYNEEWFHFFMAQVAPVDQSMPMRPHHANAPTSYGEKPTTRTTDDSPAQALYEILPEMLGKRRLASATFRSVGRVVWSDCSTRTKQDVNNILTYISKDLVYLMDADIERREIWRRTKLYQELLDAPDYYGDTSPTAIADMVAQLHWHKTPSLVGGLKRPFDDETRPLMGGKTSSLRPPKRAATESDGESFASMPRGSCATPSRSVRTCTSKEKETKVKVEKDEDMIDVVDDDDYDEFAAFRREEEPKAVSSSSESDDDGNDIPSDSMVRLVIRSEPMPTVESNSPDGSWICTAKGCTFIEGPSEDTHGFESRVRAHLIEHDNKESRINLAMTESQGHAISHLLEKLKNAIGEETSVDQQESRPPPSIKRRFFGYA